MPWTVDVDPLKVAEELKTSRIMFLMDGRVYNAEPLRWTEEEFSARTREEALRQARLIVSETQVRVERLEKDFIQRSAEALPLAYQVTPALIDAGISVWHQGRGQLCYIKPFSYAPKVVQRREEYYRIPPRMQKYLRRNVLAFVTLRPDRSLSRIDLYTQYDIAFEHYHRGCFGHFPEHYGQLSDEGVVSLFLVVERRLWEINLNSIAELSPVGLPRSSYIRRASYNWQRIASPQEEGVWSTREESRWTTSMTASSN